MAARVGVHRFMKAPCLRTRFHLVFLWTRCRNGHVAKVRPATVIAGKAVFGSAADHCDVCDGLIVERSPRYERLARA